MVAATPQKLGQKTPQVVSNEVISANIDWESSQMLFGRGERIITPSPMTLTLPLIPGQNPWFLYLGTPLAHLRQLFTISRLDTLSGISPRSNNKDLKLFRSVGTTVISFRHPESVVSINPTKMTHPQSLPPSHPPLSL